MSGDRTIAIVLGIVLCGTAFGLVGVTFWMLWRRKESTGSFYMPARNSAMFMDAASVGGSWKNSPEPALAEPARLWKENRASIPRSLSTPQNTHTDHATIQQDQRPDMSAYPLGRRAVDQLRGMEIADPSGLIQPHELEAGIPLELDAKSPLHGAAPWTGRMLTSETNAPSFMRKASLRTRRATRSGRDSGFFVPKPSSLGMRRLSRSEVNAELATGRTSSAGRPSTDAMSFKVSPMTTTSFRPDSNERRPSNDLPFGADISQSSSELDAESPMRRASFSSWRRSTFNVTTSPQERYAQATPRRPSELSGEAIMRRSSIWIERESFPPRNCRSLEIPRNTSRHPHERPIVVMNSPTESSVASDYGDVNGDETEMEDEPYTLPSLNLYFPVPSQGSQRISPLGLPASFNHKVSTLPLPSPHFKERAQQQQKQQPSESDPLALAAKKDKDSSTVHYPSWSELSGFNFMRKDSPEDVQDGGDGWRRPLPDSVAGRYELAT